MIKTWEERATDTDGGRIAIRRCMEEEIAELRNELALAEANSKYAYDALDRSQSFKQAWIDECLALNEKYSRALAENAQLVKEVQALLEPTQHEGSVSKEKPTPMPPVTLDTLREAYTGSDFSTEQSLTLDFGQNWESISEGPITLIHKFNFDSVRPKGMSVDGNLIRDAECD